MIPAPTIPRSATPFVAIVLVLVAGLGGYIGYSRLAPPPGGSEASTQVSTAAVAAKTATPIPDSAPAAAVPDESFIRKIAREEAEAALHPKHAAPPPDADDTTPDTSYQPAPAGSQPAAAPSPSAAQPAAPQNTTLPPMG